jgi:hypothetical protein
MATTNKPAAVKTRMGRTLDRIMKGYKVPERLREALREAYRYGYDDGYVTRGKYSK